MLRITACLVAVLGLTVPQEGFAKSVDAKNPGPLALEREYPAVLRVVTEVPELFEESVPRPYGLVSQTDLVDLVITLTNTQDQAVNNVVATLTSENGSGITVLTGPVSYGNIGSQLSTPRLFRIQTDGAPVAITELRLEALSDQGSQALTVLIPVWGRVIDVVDLAGGIVNGQVTSPMSRDDISWTSPEVFDRSGLPQYFDLQSLDHQRSFTVPFYGTHWGDLSIEPPVLDPDASNSRTATKDGTFDLHGRVRTTSGAPIPGVRVSLTGTVNPTVEATSDANGQYWFMNVPKGTYTRHADPPAVLRRFYRAGWSEPFTFGGGTYTDGWKGPDIPPGGSTGGGGGTPPTGGGGAPAGGGGDTKRTVVSGGLVGGGTAILDLLAAPKTWGATLLSLGGAAAIGAGTGYAADPVDTDIFWAGEEKTVPDSPDELTLEESVSMVFEIVQPPVGEQNFIINSSFNFTRVTDQKSYSWSATESLDVPMFLRLEKASAGLGSDGTEVIVSTTVLDSEYASLSGGDVVVTVHLGVFNGSEPMGMALLHDDGQYPDAVGGDGTFSASMPLEQGYVPGLDVALFALQTGFDELPGRFGSKMVNVKKKAAGLNPATIPARSSGESRPNG